MKIRRHRLVFRSAETGKKFAVVRLTSDELRLMEMAAAVTDATVEQFIISAITRIAGTNE
jgi:uncharacterized protein (DUF1778 family)